MMIQKVVNRYSLLNMLNGNLAIGLKDKMQNIDVDKLSQNQFTLYNSDIFYHNWAIIDFNLTLLSQIR